MRGTLKNPSFHFQNTHVDFLVGSAGTTGTDQQNILVYGEMKKNTTERGDYYSLSKARAFRSGFDWTAPNLIKMPVSQIKTLLSATDVDFASRVGSFTGPDVRENLNQIPVPSDLTDNSGATYWVYAEDFPKVFDYDSVFRFWSVYGPDGGKGIRTSRLSYHLVKALRKLHQCKDCRQAYRNYCQCLAQAGQPHSWRRNHSGNIVFYDVKNGNVQTSRDSFNRASTKSQRKPFIGIEIECEMQNTKSKKEQNIQLLKFCKNKHGLNFSNLFADFKSDSTLRNGVEIVSQPFSSDYYHKFRPAFEELSNQFAKLGIEGNENHIRRGGSGVGLHMHLSRDSFASPQHAQRFVKLQHTSASQLWHLSNREVNGRSVCYSGSDIRDAFNFSVNSETLKLRETADGLGLKGNGYLSDKDIKKVGKSVYAKESCSSRAWWNYGNSQTIEFRLPASVFDKQEKGKAKKYSKFCATFELLFSMVEYTRDVNFDDVSFEGYCYWLRGKKVWRNILEAIKSNEEVLKITFGVGNLVTSSDEDIKDLSKNIEELNFRRQGELRLSDISDIEEMITNAQNVVDALRGNKYLDNKIVDEKIAKFTNKKGEKKCA